MTGYEHLKGARQRCHDYEGEREQLKRKATFEEYGAKGWNTIYYQNTCVICGNTFYSLNNGVAKYCSYRCRNDANIKARKEKHARIRRKHCTCCDKIFDAKRDDTVFCSNACKQKWYRERKKTKNVTDLSFSHMCITHIGNETKAIS